MSNLFFPPKKQQEFISSINNLETKVIESSDLITDFRSKEVFDLAGPSFSVKAKKHLSDLGFFTDEDIDESLSNFYDKHPNVPTKDIAFMKGQLKADFQQSEISIVNFNAWRIENFLANLENRKPDASNLSKYGGNNDPGHRATSQEIRKSRKTMRDFVSRISPEFAEFTFPDVIKDIKRVEIHDEAQKQILKLNRDRRAIQEIANKPVDLPYRMTHKDSVRIYNHTSEPELQHTIQHDPIPPHFDSIRRRNRIELYSTF